MINSVTIPFGLMYVRFNHIFIFFTFRFHLAVWTMLAHSQAFSENIKVAGISSYLAVSLMSLEWKKYFSFSLSLFFLYFYNRYIQFFFVNF